QVLDRLKHSAKVRHIPVHLITSVNERKRAIHQGVLTYHQKPVNKTDLNHLFTHIKDYMARSVKNLLVVEDNEIQRQDIVSLIGNSDVHTVAVGTAHEALDAIKTEMFDCMILDLRLPDMSGFELLGEIKRKDPAD